MGWDWGASRWLRTYCTMASHARAAHASCMASACLQSATKQQKEGGGTVHAGVRDGNCGVYTYAVTHSIHVSSRGRVDCGVDRLESRSRVKLRGRSARVASPARGGVDYFIKAYGTPESRARFGNWPPVYRGSCTTFPRLQLSVNSPLLEYQIWNFKRGSPK